VDGKAVRGAAGAAGLVPYRLAAATHDRCAVIAERLIGPETNEVPEFAPLLRDLHERVPLAGHVIIIDVGHTDHVRTMFLHARQVFLIERYVTRKVCQRRKNSCGYKTVEVRTAVAALCITSLSAREDGPEQLAC
jgi:hypothetical protein